MNIESKIRFKAIGLYIIAGIAAVVMILFLYNMRSNILSQKTDIGKQHHVFALTNKLIYAVGDAQSSVSLFISTHDTAYIQEFQKTLGSINALIDTLTIAEPVEKEKLQHIRALLALQTTNITNLNELLETGNPLTPISERIRKYKPQKAVNSRTITIKQDTIYKAPEHSKGFFRRIKEVFSPGKNSTMVVSNVRVDTVRLTNTEAPPILSEVKNMALIAGKQYEQNLQAIGQQVAHQISDDRKISAQLSGLLLALHSQTLNVVLKTIDESEQSINRNYTVSIVGGAVALGLILLFILLIINDVNKGKEAREQLRQVMDSRHNFLLSVSHDIKSPLSSILGHLELRRRQGEDVKSMQNSARHILALLENLLEYSSIEQGSLQVSSTNFSLNELNEEIGQLFLPLAEAKNLSFIYASDTIRLHSDQIKIKQIIINLVSNAIKYTPSGAITLQMTYAGHHLHIEVRDSGAGIPADKLEEIYRPFSRVENNNTLAHGTGLGLFVVKGLIDLLGGTIDVASKVGKGTKVTVTIPCSQAENKIKQGAKKIAVYEDDPVTKEMVSNMLIQLGHKVVEREYDVILTDMEMGELSGLDILANAGTVPVIVMTGHSDFTPGKAAQLGFEGFLAKPFSMESLREIFGEGETDNYSFPEKDDEDIRELFLTSTTENFILLKQALADTNFDKAQAICHKMLPMFVMLGYPAEELRRMDARRGIIYEGWQEDVKKILSIKI